MLHQALNKAIALASSQQCSKPALLTTYPRVLVTFRTFCSVSDGLMDYPRVSLVLQHSHGIRGFQGLPQNTTEAQEHPHKFCGAQIHPQCLEEIKVFDKNLRGLSAFTVFWMGLTTFFRILVRFKVFPRVTVVNTAFTES